jgi:hypothetical protein
MPNSTVIAHTVIELLNFKKCDVFWVHPIYGIIVIQFKMEIRIRHKIRLDYKALCTCINVYSSKQTPILVHTYRRFRNVTSVLSKNNPSDKSLYVCETTGHKKTRNCR